MPESCYACYSTNECILPRKLLSKIHYVQREGFMFRYRNYSIAAGLMLLCFAPGNVRAGQQLPVYELIVSIDPAGHTIRGSARISVPKSAACRINILDFTIQQLLVNKREARPVQGIIDLRDTQKDTVVEIEYTTSFAPGSEEQKGDFLNSPAPNSISNEGVMLLHGWYPAIGGLCFYKLTAEMPEHFEAVSESETTTVKSSNGLKNIAFDFPHPLPGITLVAGTYVTRVETFHGIALKTLLFAEDRELAHNYLAHTKRYIELYESLLGPFPYKTFAIVENRFQTGVSPSHLHAARLPGYPAPVYCLILRLAMKYSTSGLVTMCM